MSSPQTGTTPSSTPEVERFPLSIPEIVEDKTAPQETFAIDRVEMLVRKLEAEAPHNKIAQRRTYVPLKERIATIEGKLKCLNECEALFDRAMHSHIGTAALDHVYEIKRNRDQLLGVLKGLNERKEKSVIDAPLSLMTDLCLGNGNVQRFMNDVECFEDVIAVIQRHLQEERNREVIWVETRRIEYLTELIIFISEPMVVSRCIGDEQRTLKRISTLKILEDMKLMAEGRLEDAKAGKVPACATMGLTL